MPVPIMAPMPSPVRSQAVRLRLRRCSGASESARICLMDLVRTVDCPPSVLSPRHDHNMCAGLVSPLSGAGPRLAGEGWCDRRREAARRNVETGVGATGGVQREIPDAIAGPERMEVEGVRWPRRSRREPSRWQQGATDGFHRLMMGTIHLHARAFDDAVEQAAGCNGDAVRKLTAGVCLPVFEDIVHWAGRS